MGSAGSSGGLFARAASGDIAPEYHDLGVIEEAKRQFRPIVVQGQAEEGGAGLEGLDLAEVRSPREKGPVEPVEDRIIVRAMRILFRTLIAHDDVFHVLQAFLQVGFPPGRRTGARFDLCNELKNLDPVIVLPVLAARAQPVHVGDVKFGLEEHGAEERGCGG